MLVKILAGVMAAIAVTGVGIYYAAPDYSLPTCPGHDCPLEGVTVTEGDGCCGKTCPVEATTVETPACCAAKPTASGDTLGACVGGMALTGTTLTAGKAPAHCCEE